MAKLTVKNVGPIREAEVEVKKHTVFIGPQGSGKSTLAKLIAICSDSDILSEANTLLQKYSLSEYVSLKSTLVLNEQQYQINYTNESSFTLNVTNNVILPEFESHINESLEKIRNTNKLISETLNRIKELKNLEISERENLFELADKLIDDFNNETNLMSDLALQKVGSTRTLYIPSERNLMALFSNSIWSLINSEANFPKTIINLGRVFEAARNDQSILHVPFLNIYYKKENGAEFIYHNNGNAINLSQSASGYQSIIPLLLVIEHQRQQSQRRFIIEEPELNLYPTAQKELIYSLMGGLQPDIEYKDAEWVITTHSPYVLSSFNTLMLAYKVAQKSDELRAEVEKIIPSRCWINPDEFVAYYVDNGTVRNIINEKTGLIADNELDDVSEDLAGEQDQLFELSRSVPRD